MQKITKEEIQIGIKEISEKCNIDKSKIIYNWEHNGLMIDDVKFEIFPSHLLFVHFNYNILFTNCSFDISNEKTAVGIFPLIATF